MLERGRDVSSPTAPCLISGGKLRMPISGCWTPNPLKFTNAFKALPLHEALSINREEKDRQGTGSVNNVERPDIPDLLYSLPLTHHAKSIEVLVSPTGVMDLTLAIR